MNGDWAARLKNATSRATFPYEVDEQQVGPPAPDLDRTMPWMPDDLITLFREVGPISLPDIGNGYFLYPPTPVDRPDRLDDAEIVVFGSNGGGDQYVRTLADGRVLRLQGLAYIDGVFVSNDVGAERVGDDLAYFLDRLVVAVEAFADHGHVTDL
ncbi:hypothetical protein GCM10010112_76460 [Actinoplanes lobatus]|uniref:Knr4/Smi1-like domain-containing protein n=1 Tax=Actinoplanes lobatus TaxID=113568 RepID=A0A7W7HM24_9ACTN|nr:hypothetical protein [Actinoplanes lobatus]MBB4752737.1 hypothetical protein [Actinoplanes lobatus]GGN90753.1 hypothetical protein GCM10010112_76460 [Actinoplanes lobatus]GIE43926.1 hypothetical protein Alo02nite_68240 [Actinoplanes lobatus]